METGETNETRLIACLLEIDTNIYSFIYLDNIISFINSENQKNFKWTCSITDTSLCSSFVCVFILLYFLFEIYSCKMIFSLKQMNIPTSFFFKKLNGFLFKRSLLFKWKVLLVFHTSYRIEWKIYLIIYLFNIYRLNRKRNKIRDKNIILKLDDKM